VRVRPDGRFDLDLRWGVPSTHRRDVPPGRLYPTRRGASTLRPTHDDRLLSAALIAEFDRLLRGAKLPPSVRHPFDELPPALLGTGRAGAHLVEPLLGSLCYAGSRKPHFLKERNGDTIYSGYLCRRDP
jgi:hypothetical protein